MSFRQFGGLNYAARNNIVSSNYNTSNNLLVTQNVGQPNSFINFQSDISGNVRFYGQFDLSGNLNVSGNITSNEIFITGPVIDVANSVVPKSYVDAIGSGLKPKTACECATTTTISGTYVTPNEFTGVGSPLIIDGYSVQNNNRVLVKNQGTLDTSLGGYISVQNGIYTYSSSGGGTLTRSTDMAAGSSVSQALIPVQFGTQNSTSTWFQALGSSQNQRIVGIDTLEFVLYIDLNINLGQGLNAKSLSGKTYINVDSSLNFINYLDSKNGVINATGNLALGTNSTNTIIGPTGGNPIQAQSIIQAQKGITGGTGSFENITVSRHSTLTGLLTANGGITGGTGSFSNIIASGTSTLTGLLTANGGITSSTGTFSSGISTNTGTFTGLLTASGGITSSTGTFSSGISTNTGTFTGLLTASGGITSSTGTFSSGISTNTGTFSNINASGTVSANSFNTQSDYRIKENIKILNESHNVDNLIPITYFNKKTEKQDIGLLAHELQEQFPCLVTGEKDAEEFQTVNYSGLIPILIKEIQEVKKEIKLLKDNILQG